MLGQASELRNKRRYRVSLAAGATVESETMNDHRRAGLVVLLDGVDQLGESAFTRFAWGHQVADELEGTGAAQAE